MAEYKRRELQTYAELVPHLSHDIEQDRYYVTSWSGCGASLPSVTTRNVRIQL